MSYNFVRVDLHIHTPESKCYKGSKNDREFLNILQKAKTEGLKMIAITDHNSIEGYKKLIELKGNLVSERKTLSSITDSHQSEERLKKVERDLSVFEDILVLPGIEFEVRNGIHLLVIFSNNIRTEIIDKFLMDGGYEPQNFGEETPSTLANWDILALFEESKKYDCLVIDAHTDSNKGILNTIPKGTLRASCFKSPQLNAVCYSSEEQIEKLKEVLSAREYTRQVPLSFVKFSDAHSVDEVGSSVTWVRLENIDFESLKTAFANPSELISVEEPSLQKILTELTTQSNTFGIPDLSPNSKEVFRRYICGLNNSIGGHVLLGVTEKKKVIGIPLTEKVEAKEGHEWIAKEIIECFRDIDGPFRYQITAYPLRSGRIVISIRIPQGSNLINIKDDGNVYSIKDNSISVLSAADVQTLVEDRLMDQMAGKIGKRVLAVEKDCQLIKNLFSTMPIMRTVERNSVVATFDIEKEKSIELEPADIQRLRKTFVNGRSKGNLFFLKESQSPRLAYTYLRYSLPLFLLRNVKQRALAKETIYIVPGGGVYFAKKDYPIFSDIGQWVLRLYKTPRNARYGIKFTACFLKSSLILWYCKNKFDDINIYHPEILRSLRLPRLDIGDQSTKDKLLEIQDCFDRIIDLERKYLVTTRRLKENELIEHTNKHNVQVDEIAYKVDHMIYQLLKLGTDEIAVIEDNLGLNEIYLPKPLV